MSPYKQQKNYQFLFSIEVNSILKRIVIFFLISFPLLCNAQLQSELKEPKTRQHTTVEDYENLVFDSSKYMLSNPVNKGSANFIGASKIVSSWMNGDTGFGVPLGGRFYYALTNTENQQYLYAVCIVNYILDQKLNHNRILKCLPIEGQIYREQEDVREVRLKGAEIFLEFAKKSKHKVKLNGKAKKYLKHYKKGTLGKVFFKKLK